MDLAALLANLANLGDLDDTELAALEADLLAAFDELSAGEVDADVLASLREITEGVEQIRTEAGARLDAAAALADEVAALAAQVRPAAEDGSDTDGDTDGDAAADDEPAVEDEQPAVEDEQPVPVAASARPAPLGRARIPASHRPSPARTTPAGVRLRAAADLPGRSAGAEFASWDDAADAMRERLQSFRGSYEGPVQFARVGTLEWDYPEDRRLSSGSPEGNLARINAVVGPEALVASGGLCAPTPVQYDVVTLGDAERPLRAALPSFNADRGGITFMAPYRLSDVVVDDTNGAIDTITVANDAADATKTIQQFGCPQEQEVTVTAITERLKFSNFKDRYWPEGMRSVMSLSRTAWARRAERGILTAIDNASTQVHGGPVEVGAARQTVMNYVIAATRYRMRHRMNPSVGLRIVLPEWLAAISFIDVLNQAPGDGIATSLPDAKAWIERALQVGANVRVTWQRDDLADTVMSAAQSAGALLDFPGTVEAYMFHEGAFLFLDGGTLDFGIVRDSTLNAANRFETFMESFEGVAFQGVESLAITSFLCANGTTGAPSTSVGCGGIGS